MVEVTPGEAISCTPSGISRRGAIKIASIGITFPFGLVTQTAEARPEIGDMLVRDDAKDGLLPLAPTDIKPGIPTLAFPYDSNSKTRRDDNRLNKVVLMRFSEKDMDAETLSRAAGGVVAYSAICTHQGCDLKTWLPAEKVLVCFCHASKFLPLEHGFVASGPAPRPLPMLPLKLEGGQLVIAGPFSATPGGGAV